MTQHLAYSLPKYAALTVLSLAVASGVWFGFTRFPVIHSIVEANVTPVSTTITWYSSTPTQGCVWMLAFPPRRRCDDHAQLRANNHLVSLTNLNPNKKYLLLLESGPAFATYTTAKRFIPEAAPGLPNPAYGQLLFPFTQNPVPYATVIAYTPAGPVATYTTKDGRFALDLKGTYKQFTSIPLTLQWGNYIIEGQQIVYGAHQPLATIILTEPWIEDQTP